MLMGSKQQAETLGAQKEQEGSPKGQMASGHQGNWARRVPGGKVTEGGPVQPTGSSDHPGLDPRVKAPLDKASVISFLTPRASPALAKLPQQCRGRSKGFLVCSIQPQAQSLGQHKA